MAKPINGSLYVESYIATGNPGEYTFENGIYTNLNDSGNGAYDIVPGFVIYIQPLDINTAIIIPGIANRYLITNVTVINAGTVSGTIIWDNLDVETDQPGSGLFSIITQTTPNLKLGIPPVDNNYFDLTPGSTLASMLNDVVNIMDRLGGNSSNNITELLPVTINGQTEFILQHVPKNKTNTSFTVNGLSYVYGEFNDFIIFDKVITWTGLSLVLDVTDNVVVKYDY